MYLITYQKRNGDIFCRVRNTLPEYQLGGETSMGWKILDIKYKFKNTYYTLSDCKKLERKQYKMNHIRRSFSKIFTKNNILIFVVIIVIIIK